MRVLGVKAAKLTNARGFCVELSTAIVGMCCLPAAVRLVFSKQMLLVVWCPPLNDKPEWPLKLMSQYRSGCIYMTLMGAHLVLHVTLLKLNKVLKRFLNGWHMYALAVMVASYTGLPVSTTQTVTGAIVAMGCFDGIRGVNWKVVAKVRLPSAN